MFCITCSAYISYKTKTGNCMSCEENIQQRILERRRLSEEDLQRARELFSQDETRRAQYRKKLHVFWDELRKRILTNLPPGRYLFTDEAAERLGIAKHGGKMKTLIAKHAICVPYTLKSGNAKNIYVFPEKIINKLSKLETIKKQRRKQLCKTQA